MFAQGEESTIFYRDLIKEVSEESILNYYTGINTIPCVTNSPLRVDNNPSFSVYYSSSGRVRCKDFGTGASLSLLELVQAKLFYSNIKEAIQNIVLNIEEIKALDTLVIKRDNLNTIKSNKHKKKVSRSLGVKIREWEDHDLKFWSNFGINLKWLQFGNVYPISHIFMGEKFFSADKYAYCYVEFKDNKPSYKIYQPFSFSWKWLNNHNSSVWDLWSQAFRTNSNKLIITSSRKDALSLWANLGIPSVALQSETTFPKPHIIDQVKSKFPNIWCLYDNDFDKERNYGREFGKQICDLYDFKQIEIPEIWKSKDPSDLYKNFGSIIFKQILNQLLEKL